MIKSIFILLLSLGVTSFFFAQEQTGSIRGVVTDQEGNVLPGVTITISSPAMMGTQTFVTTSTGAYRFPALPPGTYKLTAELPGHKTVTRENIVIRVGMTVTIDLVLEVAKLEEEVTVTAPSPTVDVQSTKISVTMDKELLRNLPLA